MIKTQRTLPTSIAWESIKDWECDMTEKMYQIGKITLDKSFSLMILGLIFKLFEGSALKEVWAVLC